MAFIVLFTALSVPKHMGLKRGRLRDLIKDAGLSVEEFVECYDEKKYSCFNGIFMMAGG